MQKFRVSAWALCALSLGFSAGISHTAFAAPPASEAARKEDARKHFETARELDSKGDVAGAVREFTASRALFKTRGNTLNLALGLRKLGRIGEALDMLEAYLADFDNTSAEDKAMVEGEIAATGQFLGKLEIDTSTAAQIVVDGVVRGKTPLAKPLRLLAGTHVVRLSPESFAARRVDTTITIIAQQTAQLKPTFEELEDHGGLNIKADSGAAFDVWIDGELIGVTPLALQLPPRDYTVWLRSADGQGSLPARATVASGRVQDLSIATLKLDASVEVQVDPPDATVYLDDVPLGRGAWRGMVSKGQHDFRAEAPGYAPRTLRATLGASEQTLQLQLKPGAGANSAGPAAGPSGFGGFGEIDLGLSLGLVAGGDLREQCSGACSSSFLIGPKAALRGGFTIDKRFELGAELSFLHMPEHIEQRPDTLSVVGKAGPQPGISNDVVKWNSVAVGAVGGLRVGPEKIPVTLRLAAGVMVGSVTDRRNGTFDAGTGAELAQAAKTAQAATHLYVAPEVRAGYAFSEHVSAGIGVRGTFAFDLAVPRWDTRRPTVLERSGLGYWSNGVGAGSAGERMMGSVRVLLDPALYFRYDF